MKSAVSLIYGADDFQAIALAKKMIGSFLAPEEHSLALITIDGSSANTSEAVSIIQQVVAELLTLGFLGKKLVWLKGANFLGATIISKSAAVQEQLAALTDIVSSGPPANHKLIITAPAADGRSRFFNAFKKHGEIITVGTDKPPWQRGKDALRQAEQSLRKRGLTAKAAVLNSLVEKVGFDSRQLEQEAEKLALFMRDRKIVEHDDIEAIVSASSEAIVWDFQDHLGNRDLANSLSSLRRLLFQGETPVRLILAIESRFRLLSVFREALDAGWLTVSSRQGGGASTVTGRIPDHLLALFESAIQTSKGKMHPFVQGKLTEQAGKFSSSELKEGSRRIMETYKKLVSSSAPRELVLELLVTRLCRGRRRRATAS